MHGLGFICQIVGLISLVMYKSKITGSPGSSTSYTINRKIVRVEFLELSLDLWKEL